MQRVQIFYVIQQTLNGKCGYIAAIELSDVKISFDYILVCNLKLFKTTCHNFASFFF